MAFKPEGPVAEYLAAEVDHDYLFTVHYSVNTHSYLRFCYNILDHNKIEVTT
jgi:hypothetical protein